MRKALILLLSLAAVTSTQAGNIVVNAGGSIHNALRQAREWRRTNDPRCEGGITITIKAGRYYMQEPLFIRPEDSGTALSPTIIRGEEGAVICGDARQQHTQLWPKDGMEQMIDFNKEARTITIPKPSVGPFAGKKRKSSSHLVVSGSEMGLEMVVYQRWAIAILRVKQIQVQGDKAIVSFMEPESRLEFEHPWPQPVIGGERGNSSYLLRTTEQRDGIEQLVVIEDADYIAFENLTFENTCWNRPLHKGHVTLQGGMPIVDAYKLTENPGLPWDNGLENQAWVERPVSAVTVRDAEQVSFRKCRFQHLGSTALDYESFEGGFIEDCTFRDIGGSAIMAGSFAESPLEVHKPYGNLAAYCSGLYIRNNIITDATNEDWGAVGIACGYVKNMVIEYNTVSHVNYSGICVGWGWTPLYTGMENNHIRNNTVSNYARQLYDAGGIYTLSYQPRSSISGNRIAQPSPAPYATNNRGFCIYLDARTDGFTIENNQTYADDSSPANSRLIRRDEIGDNHPGPNLIFKQ